MVPGWIEAIDAEVCGAMPRPGPFTPGELAKALDVSEACAVRYILLLAAPATSASRRPPCPPPRESGPCPPRRSGAPPDPASVGHGCPARGRACPTILSGARLVRGQARTPNFVSSR